MPEKRNGSGLVDELIFRGYLTHNHQPQNPDGLNMAEYIALRLVAETVSGDGECSGRTYLQELSDSMQLPMYQVSKIIGDFRDKGLVLWSHDGSGEEGTYVVITKTGRERMHRQEQMLRDYYGRVVKEYGEEDLAKLLEMVDRLEAVMKREWKEWEAADIYGNKEGIL